MDKALASGIAPNRIAYLAFTKKAAGEAVDRAKEKFSLTAKDLPYFRTLHSMAFRMLGLRKEQVLGQRAMDEFGLSLGLRLGEGAAANEGRVYGKTPGERALFISAMSRMRCVSLEDQWREMRDDVGWFEVERVHRALSEFKQDRGLYDYTDMLLNFTGESSPPLDLLVVDESQDLSQAQWRMVQALSARSARTVVAGDDDQAIFRWAGADIEYFLALPGETTVLNQSYRVPKAIQDHAASIIANVSQRKEKHWNPRAEGGLVRYHNTTADIDMSKGSWLALARNEYLLDDIEDQCRREGFVYQRHGIRSVSDKDINTIRAWELLRKDDGQDVSAADIRNILRYIPHTGPDLPKTGRFTTVNLCATWGGIDPQKVWHDAFDKMPLIERAYLLSALRHGEKIQKQPRIILSTIHSAKGGEADNVILYTDVSARTYHGMLTHPDDERRVFYVGATRAREALHIIQPRTRFFFT